MPIRNGKKRSEAVIAQKRQVSKTESIAII